MEFLFGSVQIWGLQNDTPQSSLPIVRFLEDILCDVSIDMLGISKHLFTFQKQGLSLNLMSRYAETICNNLSPF